MSSKQSFKIVGSITKAELLHAHYFSTEQRPVFLTIYHDDVRLERRAWSVIVVTVERTDKTGEGWRVTGIAPDVGRPGRDGTFTAEFRTDRDGGTFEVHFDFDSAK